MPFSNSDVDDTLGSLEECIEDATDEDRIRMYLQRLGRLLELRQRLGQSGPIRIGGYGVVTCRGIVLASDRWGDSYFSNVLYDGSTEKYEAKMAEIEIIACAAIALVSRKEKAE